MKFHSIITDDVLEYPKSMKEYLVKLHYEGQEGPDGVTYPDVTYLPFPIEEIYHEAIQNVVGFKIDPKITFARLSLEGVNAPHWAHNDKLIADYTALLYMNTHPDGGTALVTHKELGFNSGIDTEEKINVWKRDTNDLSKWDINMICPMVFNRMFITDADLLHASLPVNGFGNSLDNGRLVMICFFNELVKE